MRYLWLVLALLLSFPAASQVDARYRLRESIVQLAPLMADATAKLDPASMMLYTEHNRAVAVFTLESAVGGPASWQFVAFFERNEAWPGQPPAPHQYRLVAFQKIGDRAGRMFQSGTFQAGRLVLQGLAPAPGDSTCCPSIPIRSAFTLKGSRVVEHVLAPNNSSKPTPLRGAA